MKRSCCRVGQDVKLDDEYAKTLILLQAISISGIHMKRLSSVTLTSFPRMLVESQEPCLKFVFNVAGQ